MPGPPGPVSCTSNHSAAAPARPLSCPAMAAGQLGPARSVTVPTRVNFTALPSRLMSTWRNLPSSPWTIAGRWGWRAILGCRPLARARRANNSARSSSSACRLKSSGLMGRQSASILERSRMSLIRPSRCSPLRAMVSICSSWRGARVGSCARIWENPMTALSGVRISWLMLARKALLARLAASASSLACASSAVRASTSSLR